MARRPRYIDGESVNDDPLDEDIDRFEEGESYCPHCGAEVWEDVTVCPECRREITMPSLRPPIERWWRGKWSVVIVVAVLLGFLAMALRGLSIF